MPEWTILLDGLGIPESPRWHEGRLWFCNWIARQVMAVDMDGKAEVMLTRDPASHPMGYSIDWLPDGRLLTTGDKVRRQEPDGSTSSPVRRPSRATSSSSRRTGNSARSPVTSSSRTAWPSPRTAAH
jgi:sugar lactone lactonase YvrE